MYALMYDQSVVPTERLITYTTGVGPLSTMYALMCDQINLLKEFLFTYITAV